jgi:hypothetical protein
MHPVAKGSTSYISDNLIQTVQMPAKITLFFVAMDGMIGNDSES